MARSRMEKIREKKKQHFLRAEQQRKNEAAYQNGIHEENKNEQQNLSIPLAVDVNNNTSFSSKASDQESSKSNSLDFRHLSQSTKKRLCSIVRIQNLLKGIGKKVSGYHNSLIPEIKESEKNAFKLFAKKTIEIRKHRREIRKHRENAKNSASYFSRAKKTKKIIDNSQNARENAIKIRNRVSQYLSQTPTPQLKPSAAQKKLEQNSTKNYKPK